jgi:hypothetical protein
MFRRRTAALLVAGVAAFAPAPALAASGDTAATQAYLKADLQLAQTAAGHLPTASAAINGVLARVHRDCPHAAGNGPQDPQSTELSNEVIGAIVTAAIHPDLGSIRAFVRATSSLHWSNHALTREVHEYVSQVRAMAALPAPDVCADVRSWAASGFATLPPSTLSFSPRFMADWVALGTQPSGLSRYESSGLRSLAGRASQHEAQLSEFEAERVETWGKIMDALELFP